MAPRLSRQQRREQTRQRLLAAAATVFARHGFRGASLEQVADEAGYTKGAVYSNFASKEDLFIALLDTRCREGLEQARAVLQGSGPASKRIQEIGDRVAQRVLDNREWPMLFVEFWAWSVREPALGKRFVEIWTEARRGLARLIEDHARALGVPLRDSPDTLAAVAMALTDGLSMQLLADPAGVPAETIGRALSLLFATDGNDDAASSAPSGVKPAQPASPRRSRARPSGDR